jgi:hypothetical protein
MPVTLSVAAPVSMSGYFATTISYAHKMFKVLAHWFPKYLPDRRHWQVVQLYLRTPILGNGRYCA